MSHSCARGGEISREEYEDIRKDIEDSIGLPWEM